MGVGASLVATILLGGVRLPLRPLEPPVPPCVEEFAEGAHCVWTTTDADGRSCCREVYVLSHAPAGTPAADLASNAGSLAEPPKQ